MITYSWFIDDLQCTDENELVNVVKVIHWRLIGADGDFSHTVYGVTIIEEPDPVTFIQFSNLTQENVIEFISKYENVPALKSEIVNSINNQKQIQLVSLSPPWS